MYMYLIMAKLGIELYRNYEITIFMFCSASFSFYCTFSVTNRSLAVLKMSSSYLCSRGFETLVIYLLNEPKTKDVTRSADI